MANIVNDMLAKWFDEEGYIVRNLGKRVEWIEIVRDEFHYGRVTVIPHYDGE